MVPAGIDPWHGMIGDGKVLLTLRFTQLHHLYHSVTAAKLARRGQPIKRSASDFLISLHPSVFRHRPRIQLTKVVKSETGARSVTRPFTIASGSLYPIAIPQNIISSGGGFSISPTVR